MIKSILLWLDQYCNLYSDGCYGTPINEQRDLSGGCGKLGVFHLILLHVLSTLLSFLSTPFVLS